MNAMLLSRLKVIALLLAIGMLGGGGWLAYRSLAQEAPANQPVPRTKASKENLAKQNQPSLEPGPPPTARVESDEVQRATKEQTSREFIRLLEEHVDLKDFQNPMMFKESISLLYEKFAAKGKELPILIDVPAFRDLEADVYEATIKLPQFPRVMDTATMLRVILAQLPVPAEIIQKGRGFWITTSKRASLAHLLQEKVWGNFENRLLHDALQDLAYQGGVSIVLDPRVEDRARTPITAIFRNDATLEGAVRIVADMAGLKVVDMKSGLYVTNPANAAELQKELSAAARP